MSSVVCSRRTFSSLDAPSHVLEFGRTFSDFLFVQRTVRF